MNVITDILEPMLLDISLLIESIDRLKLKIDYLKLDYVDKSEIERNDLRLDEIRMNLSISRIERILKNKIKEFQDTITIYEYALKDCNYE